MSGPLPMQATRIDTERSAVVTTALDPWLLGCSIALGSIGLIMVGSASMAVAEDAGYSRYHYLFRHAMFLGIGSTLAAIMLRVSMERLERWGRIGILLSIPFLLLVFIPGVGVEVNGARRWIRLGISNFQVVELVKLMTIVWLAGYLVRQRDAMPHKFLAMFKPLLLVALLGVLLLAQPDFGSAVIMGSVCLGMLWMGGARVSYLGIVSAIGAGLVAALAILEPYRLRRLQSFLNPWEKPFDESFQLTQALIAIGRGEWFGVGIGASVQKLFYLPEAHTDFIFAVLAEEFGLLGVLVLIAMYALLVGRSFQLGMRAIDLRRPFAGHLAFGIGLALGIQATVSIGVNLGMLPTKGLTLPLISSGGSSVIVVCIAIGLLLRIARENQQQLGLDLRDDERGASR